MDEVTNNNTNNAEINNVASAPNNIKIEQRSKSSSKKIIILGIFILLFLFGASFLIIDNMPNKQQVNTKTQQNTVNQTAIEEPSATPTLAPLTEKEADSQFAATDTDIQATLDQADQDLNILNQTNSSLDNQSL